jgi:MFS transporter, DHA1 family, inner membrane transport protein
VLARALDDSYPIEVRTNITALTVARTTANACYRFAPPFLATIARGLDVSLDDIGVALAISELSGLLSPFTGRVVERLPRRAAMVGGLFAVAAGTTMVASSTGLVLFAIGLVVLSQSKVVFDLGLGAWLADHVAYERRSRVVGITETSWAFGLLIGVSTMGLVTAATSWRMGYVVGAVAVVTMASVVLRRLPAEPHRANRSVPSGPAGARPAGVRGWGWVVVGGNLALMAASQFLFVTFGSWLEDEFDFTAAAIAAVVFGLGLGELSSSVTSARRTDQWGKEWSAGMGALLMVPAGLGLALWNEHLVIGLVCLVIAICGFEFSIVSSLAIGSQLVAGSPARGIGMLVGAGTLGRAFASVPATRLYERGGITWPAVLCACCASVTVAAMFTVRHHRGV